MKCSQCGTEMKPIGKVDPLLIEYERRQGEYFGSVIYECPKCLKLQRGEEEKISSLEERIAKLEKELEQLVRLYNRHIDDYHTP